MSLIRIAQEQGVKILGDISSHVLEAWVGFHMQADAGGGGHFQHDKHTTAVHEHVYT